MRTRKSASLLAGKRDIILSRVLARMSYWRRKLSNVGIFLILRSGEGLTSFNKITVLTFLVKKSSVKLTGVSFF